MSREALHDLVKLSHGLIEVIPYVVPIIVEGVGIAAVVGLGLKRKHNRSVMLLRAEVSL